MLTEEIVRGRRAGTPPLALLIDCDDFKRVNDLYGHRCGDRVLVKSAQILASLARATDVVARYSGEEFVMLLPGCGSDGAVRFCQRLLDAFASTSYELDDGERLTVTVSLGLAVHGEDSSFESSEQMLRCADQALYEAKQAGKNRVVMHRRPANAA